MQRTLAYSARSWRSGLFACALVASTGCGVRDYPHALPPVDTSDDFGPATPGYSGKAHDGGARSQDAAPGSDAQTPQPSDAGSDAASSGDGGPVELTAANADIVLGDTALRKDDVIAFIHFGHSNMQGGAVTPEAERPYHFAADEPHGWMYHLGEMPQPVHEPTASDWKEMKAGPGTALIKQAVQRAPKKYFLSIGWAMTASYCTHYLPGGPYYDNITAAAIAIKDRVTFGAIVVMLGCTEFHRSDDVIKDFPNCINTVVTAIRNAVGRPDLPMLMSDYEREGTGEYDPKGEFAQRIMPMIELVPSVVSNSALVPTDKITMQDDHHFDLNGQKEWSRRALDIMQDRGWFPWAQPTTAP